MKYIRDCPDNCGEKIYEISQYKGFTIELWPYAKGFKTVKAIRNNPEKIDEVLLASEPFNDYGTLKDDTAHSYGPTVKKLVAQIKKGIDNYEQVRNEIITQVTSYGKTGNKEVKE